MIRHCVFIRFKPSISAADKAGLFQEIEALQDHLSGILAVHIGGNVSPETGMDKGFSDGFIVDFEDGPARDAYLEDPRHKEAGGKLVAAAEGGIAGILVYDIETGDL
jgi:hypothetical protein